MEIGFDLGAGQMAWKFDYFDRFSIRLYDAPLGGPRLDPIASFRDVF